MKHAAVDDPDLMLSELMNRWPRTVSVFVRHRMLCVGCTIGPFHTVSDACQEYGLDEDQFIEELKLSISATAGPR